MKQTGPPYTRKIHMFWIPDLSHVTMTSGRGKPLMEGRRFVDGDDKSEEVFRTRIRRHL